MATEFDQFPIVQTATESFDQFPVVGADDGFDQFPLAETAVAVADEGPPQSNDILRRIPADIARSSMNTLAGGVRAIGLASQGVGDLLGIQMEAPYQDTANALAEKGTELYNYYGTDPRQDQALRSKLSQGGSSIVTALGTGPLAPITGGLQAGEAGFQEAQQFNANPEDAALSFAGNAAIAGVTEKLLGVVPNLPKFIKGVPAKSFAEAALQTASGILKGSAREGSQEALEQIASNLIAKETYDPNRDVMEGVAESALVGGILGGGLGGIVRGGTTEIQGEPQAPQPTREDEIISQIEDLNEPDLTGFGSQASDTDSVVEEAPPPVITPTQTASATVLGVDPQTLREDEAIVTGQPVPIFSDPVEEAPVEQVVEEVAPEAPESTPPPAVEAPLTPEEGQDTTQPVEEAVAPILEVPEGVAIIEPDSYERLADEPLNEGFVALKDAETNDIFQVPASATPQEIQIVREQARSASLEAEFEMLRKEQARLDEVLKVQKQILSGPPINRKSLTPSAPVEEIWRDIDKINFALPREKMQLEEAKKNLARLQSSADQRAKQDAAEEVRVRQRGVEVLTEWKSQLEPKVEAARKAVKGMKKGQKPEGGAVGSAGGSSVTRSTGPDLTTLKGIPQEVIELGKALYRKDISFADWSKAMIANLGTSIKESLKAIYDAVSYIMDAPIRARVRGQDGMRRAAPRTEGGAIGSAGGTRTPPPAATPEPAPQEDPVKAVGIMNSNTDAARVRMGLPAAMAPARIKLGDVWNEAMAVIAQNPNAGTDLVVQLAVEPREITPVETAILVHERVMRDTAYERALNAVNNSKTDGEVKANQELLNRAGQNNLALFNVTKAVGTKAGQALAARKLLVDEELNLARMAREHQAAQGGKPLSSEQMAEIKRLHDELEKVKAELAKKEEQQSQQDAKLTFQQMMKELNSDRKEAVKSGKSVTEFLNEQADKARERLRGKLTKVGSIPDPTILVDLSIIGASHIANGISSLADFTVRMVAEFGEDFRPYMEDIHRESVRLNETNQKAFNATPKEEAPADVLKRATPTLDPKVVFDLARAYVRQGITGMENVMNAVHGDLVKLIPGLTVRDVRDAFSGYGKTTYPSKQEDLVKLREYKTLARLTSQLEDVLKRQAPLRTGPQRDKLSTEARILQKQINDLMKSLGIQTTSPEQQLKTSAEAVKTRLRNQIEELDKAIRDNQALPTNRRTVQYDTEAKALRDRRDALKARYNELFRPPEKTAAEKIQSVLKNLDKAIAQESQMLREGILKRPGPGLRPTNADIENKQMELDALRQLRRELYAETQPRKSAEDVALEQALKAAKASIDRMDQMFKSGNLTPAQRAQRFNPTAELEALWSERDAMRDALAELRRAQKPRTDPEEIRRKQAIKALEKSIRMLDERMLRGDFSPAPRRANRPEVKEVAELRELRDSMREAFNDLKKAQTPPKDPLQIRLEADKKLIKTRIRKLQEKINAGDYAPAPKRDKVADDEKLQLELDYQKLREQYLKGVFELQLKQRGPIKKAIGTVAETLNLSRAILTSADFSGLLRQGGFIAFGNPVRAAKALKPMFKSFASEKGQLKAKRDLEKRDNYALYNQAGLYLADTAPASLSQMEEAYMSRWLDKIPKWMGGGILRGSQRAYVTVLNQLRADTFDAMAEGLAINGRPTLDEAKALANFINVATGRGALNPKYAGIGQALNTAFFAPRYVMSRFQLLAGQPFYGGNARTRKAIAKEYAKYLGGVGATLALLAMMGDDEDRGEIGGFKVNFETDPRSSDFLKPRFGNTRLDIFSGLLQATVLASRLYTEKSKVGGRIVNLTGKDRKITDPTWIEVGTNFLRTKLAPLPGSFVDYKTGSNVVGDEMTPTDVALKMAVPISFGEIKETMKEQGIPTGTAMMLLSLFGIGLQTYPERAKKTKDERF